MTTSEHLKKAKQYIEDHGWVSGLLFTETGRVCAVGAVRAVKHQAIGLLGLGVPVHGEKDCRVYLAMAANPDTLFTVSPGNVTIYNDCYIKSQEQVLAWFDTAIALAEEQETGKPLDEIHTAAQKEQDCKPYSSPTRQQSNQLILTTS